MFKLQYIKFSMPFKILNIMSLICFHTPGLYIVYYRMRWQKKTNQYSVLCLVMGSLSYPDVLEEDPASALILHTHQLLRMLTFLLRLSAEELGKIWQGFIIPVKIIRLGKKYIK